MEIGVHGLAQNHEFRADHVQNENDTVVKPKESALFGYYADGDTKQILPLQETKPYLEDWIGLKILHKSGRLKFITVTGGHVKISDSDIKKHVVPYLREKPRWMWLGREPPKVGKSI
ncbi:alpha/beta-Hydrolases superfamily protein [Striga asiatica]|uniref:Alpha/beta-Hydrolases superfamily protein n=1 Tax=Striga asiatica TaxID=4170 RepID=A0A5A7NYU0_STRAF|nr:alpha/beta-Hydrolases superfamily protein [Striga asiatica]